MGESLRSIKTKLGLWAICAGISGCGESAPAQQEEVSEFTERIMQDPSGTITVRVRTCGFATQASTQTATCGVVDDFVLVGGGAEILGPNDEKDPQPGALLVGSYPRGSPKRGRH